MVNIEIIYHSGKAVHVETDHVQRHYTNGQTGLSSHVKELGCDRDFIEYSMQHGQPLRIIDPKEGVVDRLVDMHNVREVRNLRYRTSASELRSLSPAHAPTPAPQLAGQDVQPPRSGNVGTT